MTPLTLAACNPLQRFHLANAKNSPEIKGFAKPHGLG
jgi:hypothetical protein